jgi:hypothetical protein
VIPVPVPGLQHIYYQSGRIRTGRKILASNGKLRPARLETFRFTTRSTVAAAEIARLFGGQVTPWNRQHEVITDAAELPVMIPPRADLVTQWLEMWNAGGCVHRCDGAVDQVSGLPCVCPADPGTRDELARLNPPRACKLITRLSVMIPDLPGLGVWRLDTGSWWAAAEISAAAALLAAARARGIWLPGMLRLETRERLAGGRTTEFPVPVLEVLATLRQIMGGELDQVGFAALLPPPPPGGRRALPPAPVTADQGAGPGPEADPDPGVSAQDIADQIIAAATRAQVAHLATQAKAAGVADDVVFGPPAGDPDAAQFEQFLSEFGNAWWNTLPVGT